LKENQIFEFGLLVAASYKTSWLSGSAMLRSAKYCFLISKMGISN
jgi:hypothetical protein